MERRAATISRLFSAILLPLVLLAGCTELKDMGLDVDPPDIGLSDAFRNMAGPSREVVAMLAAVNEQPITEFRARPHLGIEIRTQGYSRRHYFLAAPAQVQFTPKACDQIFLAGDGSGDMPLQINNLLLIELQQGSRNQNLALGTTEAVVYRGQLVPFLGAKRSIVPSRDIRLDRVLQPDQDVTLTVTALSNNDSGSISNVFLVIENYGAPEVGPDGISRCPSTRPAVPAGSPQAAPVQRQPETPRLSNRQAPPQPAPPPPLPEGLTTLKPGQVEPSGNQSQNSSGSIFGVEIGGQPTSLPDQNDR